MQHDAAIIEVGLNEAVTPRAHPHVPQTPAACAADARRCVSSGAAVVHWHAVDHESNQRLGDTTLYGEALDAMGDAVIAYPSYPIDVPDTVDERLGHCLALRRHHGLELGPIDVSSVNIVVADPSGRAIAPLEAAPGFEVIRNSLPFVVAALARYRAEGLVPTLGSFDPGSTRLVGALARSGLLDEPVLLKIFLWESPLIGPIPSVEALDLHLRQLPPELDVEWLVVASGFADPARVERLVRAALERGGGVRVGIGDNAGAYPELTNAQVVEVATGWVGESGRPVASVDDVRARFGLTRR
jgi:uncharacterized protein (DUF849 family)